MLTLSVLLTCACALPSNKPVYDLAKAGYHFNQFIQEHNRIYGGGEEKQMRFEIFKKNLEEINRRNLMKNEHAVFGITKFTDMTSNEMKSYTGFLSSSSQYTSPLAKPQDAEFVAAPTGIVCETQIIGDGWNRGSSNFVPDSFDWRDKNAVSDVKAHSSRCHSGWAFSITGNIEGQYAIKNNKPITFSAQQILDCDKTNKGCIGGLINNGLGDVIANGGLMTDEEYPYKDLEESCKFDVSKAKAKLAKCISFDLRNEEKLKELLYKNGPISIDIDACSIFLYRGGVFKDCTFEELNFAALLVGYGTEDGVPYWTIKTAEGEKFGEKGNIRVQRGKNSCGMINSCAATAILA